jgi:hypothetical protein
MEHVSPAIVDRIVQELSASGSPRTSGALARDHLGLGLLDEAVADRLLAPVLGSDPRLKRTPAGWTVGTPARGPREGRLGPNVPHLVIAAPRAAAGAHRGIAVGRGEPEYVVALGGAEEVAAYERASGKRLGLPVVRLTTVVRRLRGYRGPADPVRIAEVLGLPHVQGEGLEGWTAVIASCWEHLATELADEGVRDLDALGHRVEERLEAASFEGKEISPEQLANLPEEPGIYVFRDRRGHPLYVGQSGNLRERVASYFVGPPRDDKDRALRARGHSLGVRTTDTGLDAWIAEMRAIRRLRPAMNTRRRVPEGRGRDGWLLVPDPARPGRAALFGLWDGLLADRGVVPREEGRRLVAIERVLSGEGKLAGRAAAAEAGRLVDSWSRKHPAHPFLQLGVDGSREAIARTVLARMKDLDECVVSSKRRGE